MNEHSLVNGTALDDGIGYNRTEVAPTIPVQNLVRTEQSLTTVPTEEQVKKQIKKTLKEEAKKKPDTSSKKRGKKVARKPSHEEYAKAVLSQRNQKVPEDFNVKIFNSHKIYIPNYDIAFNMFLYDVGFVPKDSNVMHELVFITREELYSENSVDIFIERMEEVRKSNLDHLIKRTAMLDEESEYQKLDAASIKIMSGIYKLTDELRVDDPKLRKKVEFVVKSVTANKDFQLSEKMEKKRKKLEKKYRKTAKYFPSINSFFSYYPVSDNTLKVIIDPLFLKKGHAILGETHGRNYANNIIIYKELELDEEKIKVYERKKQHHDKQIIMHEYIHLMLGWLCKSGEFDLRLTDLPATDIADKELLQETIYNELKELAGKTYSDLSKKEEKDFLEEVSSNEKLLNIIKVGMGEAAPTVAKMFDYIRMKFFIDSYVRANKDIYKDHPQMGTTTAQEFFAYTGQYGISEKLMGLFMPKFTSLAKSLMEKCIEKNPEHDCLLEEVGKQVTENPVGKRTTLEQIKADCVNAKVPSVENFK